MVKYNKILAIGAHPDDIEYGCGGFLMKIGAESDKFAFVASLGSAGDETSGLSRAKECKNAMKIIKVNKLVFREEVGISYDKYEQISNMINKIINDFNPDLILTHSQNDTHQEHFILSQCVLTAARRSRSSILFFNLLSNTPSFKAEIFVDIGDVIERKIEALSQHISQKGKYYMTKEYLDIFHSNRYAVLHGIRYSEVFEIYRIFI